MNREETKRIIAVLSATYPNWKIENPTLTVDTWQMMLSDFSYKETEIAVMQYVRTKGSAFAPAVSEIIAMIHRTEELAQTSDADAWAMVRKAISRASYYSEEEFAKLPKPVQKAVGAPSQLRIWAMDEDFNEGVESSNFYKRYNAELKRENEINWMPAEARMKLEAVQSNLIGMRNDN